MVQKQCEIHRLKCCLSWSLCIDYALLQASLINDLQQASAKMPKSNSNGQTSALNKSAEHWAVKLRSPILSPSLFLFVSFCLLLIPFCWWIYEFFVPRSARTHCKWKIWKMPIEIGRRIGLQLCSLLNTWMIAHQPWYWYEAMAKSIPLPLFLHPSECCMQHWANLFMLLWLLMQLCVKYERNIWFVYGTSGSNNNNNNNRRGYRIHLCSGISAIAGKFFIASFWIFLIFQINKANRAQFGV